MDGFRFDEGTVPTRGPDGARMRYPPIVSLTELADQLEETKLIVEAWDAGGLYELGSFRGRRWSEWNGGFHDDVQGLFGATPAHRSCRNAHRGQLRPLPVGSAAGERRRQLRHCYDGFTLNDLVSYERKHNESNGEGNRDCSGENFSRNCGSEGEMNDPAVEALRERQIRTSAVLLLFSQASR